MERSSLIDENFDERASRKHSQYRSGAMFVVHKITDTATCKSGKRNKSEEIECNQSDDVKNWCR